MVPYTFTWQKSIQSALALQSRRAMFLHLHGNSIVARLIAYFKLDKLIDPFQREQLVYDIKVLQKYSIFKPIWKSNENLVV